MEARKVSFGAVAAGGLWLILIFIAGIYLVEAPSYEKPKAPFDEMDQRPLMPSKNPKFIEEQYASRRMKKYANSLQEEKERLEREYDKLPPFEVPPHNRLTQEHIEKFIAVQSYGVKEWKKFKKKFLGDSPGLLRSLVFAGMGSNLTMTLAKKALVVNQVRQEEFEWITKNIMLAGIFCARWALEHQPLSEEQRIHLENTLEGMYMHAGIMVQAEDGTYELHPERYDPRSIPRGNIELFLDNYKRINHHRVHFTKPTVINFDREGILAAAAQNPP